MILALALGCRPDAVEPPPVVYETYDPVDHVDPFIGTGGLGAQTTGVNPGAAVPFGMTLTGPDTRDEAGSAASFYHYGGYHWNDVSIDGFSHTHSHGMGVNDYGGVLVMPRAGWDPAYTGARGRMAPFDHDHEDAGAGWYSVELLDQAIGVEIAATTRGALHRYTFPAGGADPVVLLDLGHTLGDVEIGPDSWLEVDGAEIHGFQRLLGAYSSRYGGLETSFVLAFDPAPVAVGAWSDPSAPIEGAVSAAGPTAGAWVRFPPGTEVVTLRTALSYVDLDGARANLAAETPDTDFDAARDRAVQTWRTELDNVRIWGGTTGDDDVRAQFHTAQYHTMLMPRIFQDTDGRYRGLDGEVHTADFDYYSDLSLWDTYRTLHPWYVLARPERQRGVLRSLVRMIEDGGALPRWPLGHGYTGGMVGSPGAIVVADSWLKGLVDGWDAEAAFDASFAQAIGPTPPESRDGVEDWATLGYVPAEDGEGAALTLEYAWADSALAGMATSLGRTDEARRLAELGSGWRNTWNPEVGFFQSRNRDGTFGAFGDPLVWDTDYVEGNAWAYLWMVPYDVEGMIEVQHGGDAAAFHERYAAYWAEVAAEPDDFFPDDWYWHGNEPVLHYAWLGSLSGRPDLTADAVREVLATRYAASPEGLDGNDDGGTLSAWYLWAALGLYPVAGTTTYALGSPIVAHAEIEGPDGLLVIDAPGTSDARRYPAAVRVDGVTVSGTVEHADLAGAHLEFDLVEVEEAEGSM